MLLWKQQYSGLHNLLSALCDTSIIWTYTGASAPFPDLEGTEICVKFAVSDNVCMFVCGLSGVFQSSCTRLGSAAVNKAVVPVDLMSTNLTGNLENQR